MYTYNGLKCPVCGNTLSDDDDVVVCPICGAPHHRSCYLETGHCALEDKHGTDQQWKREDNISNDDNSFDDSNSGFAFDNGQHNNGSEQTVECPRCKAKNNSLMNFCTRCGYPLNPNINPNAYTPNGRATGQNIAFVYDPYGGVDPNSSIEDVPVADIAAFVGQNSMYYIPRFKAMSEGKHKNYLNFSAAFFGPGWFAFRKMPWYAVIVGLLTVLAETLYKIACITPDVASSLQLEYGVPVKSFTLPSYVPILLFILVFAVRLVIFIFGNRIYMRYVLNSVKMCSEKYQSIDELEYQRALTKHGNINLFAGSLAIFAYYILSTVLLYLLIL